MPAGMMTRAGQGSCARPEGKGQPKIENCQPPRCQRKDSGLGWGNRIKSQLLSGGTVSGSQRMKGEGRQVKAGRHLSAWECRKRRFRVICSFFWAPGL